jgi:hypothetical protein
MLKNSARMKRTNQPTLTRYLNAQLGQPRFGNMDFRDGLKSITLNGITLNSITDAHHLHLGNHAAADIKNNQLSN